MPTSDELGIYYGLLGLSFGLGCIAGAMVVHFAARWSAAEEEHHKTKKAMREGGPR